MLRRINLFITLLLLTLSIAPTNLNFAQSEFRIIVVGIALDINSKQPLEGETVELQDMLTKESRIFETKKDGSFYFQLQAEKLYTISQIGLGGNIIESKEIQTVGKKSTEIMYIMFGSDF